MAVSRRLAIVLAAVFFAATAAVVATTAQPERADAANTVTVRGCTGTGVVLETNEKRMLDLHNQKRKSQGLRTLCVHPALQRAAEKHSQDMIDRDYFSHNTKGSGTTFAQRIKREGYRYRMAGENIAWGSGSLGSADSIFRTWMNSSGHRKNILTPGYREIGIGASEPGTFRYNGRNYRGAVLWTADFGTR
jgi:uncharacterized protein YkwD